MEEDIPNADHDQQRGHCDGTVVRHLVQSLSGVEVSSSDGEM